MIYTSGSTGKPKGVAMEHRSIVNMLHWHADTRPESTGLKTLQYCAISFDFSVHEIFSALCLGGRLVLVDAAIRRNPFALAAFIQTRQIEKLFMPVAALQQYAEAVEPATLPGTLREVITTGEQLTLTPGITDLLQQTGARLHNHYGATEFQDAATYTLTGDPVDWPAIVPMGWPISQVQVHILDAAGQPVPDGEDGEIHIGGAGLARGYLHRPELTAEKFIPNPSGAGRWYKTGDLGRTQANGILEHRGRADHQVKIRGVRVELGEIEAVLAQHPTVRNNAVLAQASGQTKTKRLVAYVVVRPEELINAQKGQADIHIQVQTRLPDYLAERLPETMLPEAYIVLDAMPLTPSGKLDRRALPVPETYRRTLAEPVVLAQSETEQRLVDIWQAVLQLDRISIQDNFFELGANSVLLVQAQKQVNAAFNTTLTPVALYQYPTIQALARHLRQPNQINQPDQIQRNTRKMTEHTDIAIIGLAGRFPGADHTEAYWQNLRDGVESITYFSEEDLTQSDKALREHPDYVQAGAILSNIDLFDAVFFDINAKEAATMDPQHRLALEMAWETLENAGYDAARPIPEPSGCMPDPAAAPIWSTTFCHRQAIHQTDLWLKRICNSYKSNWAMTAIIYRPGSRTN